MPRSPRFKLCGACKKPMPKSDSHSTCLKCLGETHQRGCCKISSPDTEGQKPTIKVYTYGGGPLTTFELIVSSTSTSAWNALASIRESVPRKDSGTEDPQHHKESLAPRDTLRAQHCSDSSIPRKKQNKSDGVAHQHPNNQGIRMRLECDLCRAIQALLRWLQHC